MAKKWIQGLSGTREYSSISHLAMSNTMTIVTYRYEIGKFPVFPISIYMMNDEYPLIFISTIMTILAICSPCVFSIATGFLSFNRISIPFFKKASSSTKFSMSVASQEPVRSNLKGFITLNADSLYFCFFYLCRAVLRAETLRLCRGFFRNKFNLTMLTSIKDTRFTSKYTSALPSTCNISVLMTEWHGKFNTTDRASFFNFFHKEMIA